MNLSFHVLPSSYYCYHVYDDYGIYCRDLLFCGYSSKTYRRLYRNCHVYFILAIISISLSIIIFTVAIVRGISTATTRYSSICVLPIIIIPHSIILLTMAIVRGLATAITKTSSTFVFAISSITHFVILLTMAIFRGLATITAKYSSSSFVVFV